MNWMDFKALTPLAQLRWEQENDRKIAALVIPLVERYTALPAQTGAGSYFVSEAGSGRQETLIRMAAEIASALGVNLERDILRSMAFSFLYAGGIRRANIPFGRTYALALIRIIKDEMLAITVHDAINRAWIAFTERAERIDFLR